MWQYPLCTFPPTFDIILIFIPCKCITLPSQLRGLGLQNVSMPWGMITCCVDAPQLAHVTSIPCNMHTQLPQNFEGPWPLHWNILHTHNPDGTPDPLNTWVIPSFWDCPLNIQTYKAATLSLALCWLSCFMMRAVSILDFFTEKYLSLNHVEFRALEHMGNPIPEWNTSAFSCFSCAKLSLWPLKALRHFTWLQFSNMFLC